MSHHIDLEDIRSEFPALHQLVYNKPLVYLDNAATTQKPTSVIRRMFQYYEQENSNIHRGVHHLSQQATEAFEAARAYVANLIHAQYAHEVIFTRGATEAINLVASSLGELLLQTNDSVLVTAMEHHSNFVPWQQLCKRKNAHLLTLPFSREGELDLEEYAALLAKNPKIVAFTHISNTLGTINPIREMIGMAHEKGIPVLIDGAQSIAHKAVDVQDLDCDFFVFSAHKAYGPMGAGVLYGKQKWLDQMPPYQYGGEMVDKVSISQTSFNVLPFKFEAGTPDVAAVLGMETALRFISDVGYDWIGNHEHQLVDYATTELSQIADIRFFGQSAHKASVVSFLVGQIHPFDLGTLLDKMGVAVRTGHHCAQPVMDFYGIHGTVRASFALYNTIEEVDVFVSAVKKAVRMLS